MRKITIAVTGLNAIDSPGPGIAVIRGLRESKHFEARIVGLSYENLEPGIYMHDLVDKTYQIPYPSVGHETLMGRLEYIHEKEKLDVVIPNFDAELFSFIKLAPRLKAMGIHTLLPSVEQFEARHKGNLPEFGSQYGVNVPHSVAVYGIEELYRELPQFRYPVVVKGKFYEAYVAQNEEQAVGYFYKLSAKWGTPIILQQFVKGQEVNVTAIGDGTGRLMGAVPMRKTYITATGKGWAGIALDAPDLMALARTIVEGTRWPGGMEIELIREDGTDTLYLIEINPRFPAWVYLAVGCGQNHPEAVVRLAMGDTDVEPFTDHEVGKMFIRYSWDMICDLGEFEQISTAGEL
jgi:carbamoyl-phosphate synthase large subunit